MAQIAAQKCEFSCDEVAVLYCKGCDQFLCVECRQNVHDRVRKFKDHEVVDIHKEGNRVRPNPLCETHTNQFLYYCSKCECLTCAECMTSSHNEHKTEKIKTVADARRRNLKHIIEQLKTKVEKVKKKLETIDTEHSIQIKSDCESYVKTVEETVDDLHKIVDRHKLIPMTTASDFKNIENEDLGRKRAFFRNRQDDIVDRLLKFENLLLETHDSTFLTEWKALQTDVKINNEETDDPIAAPRRIESFNQKKLTRSVIDEIDEKFQMKLKEQEEAVIRLTEGIGALKDELKEKQEQIDDKSKLLQGLKEKERMVTGLQEENNKLTTEFKQREIKAFSQLKEKEKRVNSLLEENDKLKSNINIKQDELEKMSELLQRLNVKEIMIKGLQEENSKLTTEYKQREIKAFSQLEEKEKKLNVLLEENSKLKSSIRTNQDELDKMSNEVHTYEDRTKKVTKNLEDKIKELESKLKETVEKENTSKLKTGKGPQYILKDFNTVNESDNQLKESDLDKSVAGKFPGSSTELKTLQLKKLQFSVLQNLDFISFLHKEMPTCNAELNQNAITFTGTQREVTKKMRTFFDYYVDIECVKHVQGKTSQIPEKMLEFVQRENIREYINRKLEKEGILCYWYGDKDEGYIKLFTLRGMGSKAVAVVQMCLDWELFAYTENVEAILKEKSMESFLDNQKSNLMLDINVEDLVVVGLESSMRNVVELYHKIVQANTKIDDKQTLNLHGERTDLSPNILKHIRNFQSDELEKFEIKWNVTFKEVNEVVLIVGETSAVKKALECVKKDSYIEQKWSCQLPIPIDVIKELSSKLIPQLEKQFCCSVFTNVDTRCRSHQQLAHWISRANNQQLIFAHGSDIAADVIVCPVTTSGEPLGFGKIGQDLLKLGGSVMQNAVKTIGRFKEVVISSATGNLSCLMVAYFPVPYSKPGVQVQKEMVKIIQDILTEVEINQLQSVVFYTDIMDDIPESTFLHWFLHGYNACQPKLNCINQIYLCTRSDNPFSLLTILKDELSKSHGMVDFTDMFENRSSRCSVIRKPADISIRIVKGKLIDQKVDVIVNSSNRQLDLRKGAVSASILAAAGDGIYEECKQNYLNGINYGEVITTNSGNLNYKCICHGCLPYWNPVADISCQILAKLVFGCLLQAENYTSGSIAFPVFGTGNLLYPCDEVAKTMIGTIFGI